ncbi:helix-turn-helix domain-containing protein [Paenibacillus campi]|uniref:TetR/AcrR family transcriptional regulator n=1 Tax=Paenibacillus campi TaxID=3106031 RepID=UPI002AFF6FA0|nr:MULTISPECIES: helix-turn-helix domain-containing protein [unclassified Paenibacillus]
MNKDEEHVKLRILKATRKLAAARGFDATTVREICREADANISLVSYYYGGKEQLFEAMLAAFLLGKPFSDALRQKELDPVSGVQKLVARLFELWQHDPEISIILHQEFALRSERIEVIQRYTLPAWSLLRHYLEQGRAEGLFHFRSLDLALLQMIGSIIFASNTVKSYPVMPLLDEQPLAPEEHLTQLTGSLLASVGYPALTIGDNNG